MRLPVMSAVSPASFTLIVATTPSLGIGKSGTLPWPRIKAEMAYFARITKRTTVENKLNVVIMGRKTWESIPVKFRPLPDRVNVIISRQPENIELGPLTDGKRAFTSSSMQDAIKQLQRQDVGRGVDRVFVIGGAQIYADGLKMREAERVLVTRIKKDYECDTFFPVQLGKAEKGGEHWVKKSDAERDAWLGEEESGGEEWEVEMWERKQM